MAEVQPLNALHYNLAAIPSLADVVAPPYDVIDADAPRRAARPLAVQRGRDRPARGARGRRPATSTPTRRSRSGRCRASSTADREPALWALTQEYDGARRLAPDAPRAALPGPGDPLRPRPRAPARAHPAGAEGGPPAADRGDPPQPLADLLPARGRRLAPPRGLHPRRALGRGHRRRGHHPPDLARSTTPRPTARSPPSSPTPELLIADGHHRYETARTYADEIGGDGPHRYTLMALVSLEDPGLTVFGYHRLLSNLGETAAQEALREAIAGQLRGRRGRRSSSSTRPARRASASSATSTPTTARAIGCGSRTRRRSRRAMPGRLAAPSASSTRRSSSRCCCAARSG